METPRTIDLLDAVGGLAAGGPDADACALLPPPPLPAELQPSAGGAGAGGAPLLADLTTLHVGGPADRYVEATSEEELVTAVRDADAAGEPVLVLGGGSNLLVADAGFPGLVVRDVRTGVQVPDASACAGVTLTVPAGTPWEDLVDHVVDNELVGLEALAGIPGSTGAAPVQNIGAYGQEVAQTIAQVRVWDRGRGAVRTLPLVTLAFGYRTSLLKRSMQPGFAEPVRRGDATPDPRAPWRPTPRYVVLDVTFQLRPGSLGAPVTYAELARALDVPVGGRAPLGDVRAAVLALRRGKGMVLDPADADTSSAGSFFTNPVLDEAAAAALPAEAPRWPVPGEPGRVKTSAAWLIEHAGFHRGWGHGAASLSTKHTLAVTNRGAATAADVLGVARAVRDGVARRFGVRLEPEPVLVGVSL